MAKTTVVRPAQESDLDDLVVLQQQLFSQDAGVHGTHVDLSWPQREGRADFEQLLRTDRRLVLIATDGAAAPTAVGFLVGYVSEPTATRVAVDLAVLRSLFVAEDHRNRHVGKDLCEAFIDWATQHGCVSATVTAYAANERAQRFYQRLGFEAESIIRTRPLL